MELNFWLSPSARQCQNPCSRPQPVYWDLSTNHDWPVKNAIANLPIGLKGNVRRISRNLLSPWGQNKDIGTEHRCYSLGLKGASNVELASQKLGHK